MFFWRNSSPWRILWLIGIAVLYLGLASYQLGLPGLHYDEAAEAGVNAMQLLTGAPVTAFRNSTITLFGWQLPLMVQDYIGALNVYLALPFLAFTGIGVPNLRIVAVLTGLFTLLLLERTLTEWTEWNEDERTHHAPRTTHHAPLFALTLLAASPSFVFWSRQGIFVTNLTQPLCLLCIWQGLRWLRGGRPLTLIMSAFAGGLAIYAKLLALWVIGPFGLLAAGWWLGQRLTQPAKAPALSWRLSLAMVVAFLLGSGPLLLFNFQTGGLWQSVAGNLEQSYYGVNNRDLLHNAAVRWGQLLQSLRGDHFWYLGGIYGNLLAPWLGVGGLLIGLVRNWRLLLSPLLLLLLTFLCSLFTISDLFITHYALVQPLVVATIALSVSTLLDRKLKAQEEMPDPKRKNSSLPVGRVRVGLLPHLTTLLFLTLWFTADLTATLRYHRTLAQSGGLADHANVSYHLAYYLRYHGLGAPVVLDWGLAAPIRYLSAGTVTPLEIFGYSDLTQPDAEFAQRLEPFLGNEANVYLLHAPEQAVFAGRREVLQAESQRRGLRLILEATFAQRDGVPLVEIWRCVAVKNGEK